MIIFIYDKEDNIAMYPHFYELYQLVHSDNVDFEYLKHINATLIFGKENLINHIGKKEFKKHIPSYTAIITKPTLIFYYGELVVPLVSASYFKYLYEYKIDEYNDIDDINYMIVNSILTNNQGGYKFNEIYIDN